MRPFAARRAALGGAVESKPWSMLEWEELGGWLRGHATGRFFVDMSCPFSCCVKTSPSNRRRLLYTIAVGSPPTVAGHPPTAVGCPSSAVQLCTGTLSWRLDGPISFPFSFTQQTARHVTSLHAK